MLLICWTLLKHALDSIEIIAWNAAFRGVRKRELRVNICTKVNFRLCSSFDAGYYIFKYLHDLQILLVYLFYISIVSVLRSVKII